MCIHVPGLLYRNHRRDQGSYYCVFMSLVSYTEITEETRTHIIVYSCPWSLIQKSQKRPGLILLCIQVPGLLYRNHRRDQGSYYCVFMSLVSYTEITEETRAHIIVYSCPWSLIQKSQKRPGLILLYIHVPGLLYRNHRRDQGSYYCVFTSLVSYTEITEETRAHIIVYSCPWSLIHKSQKRPGLILLCIHVPGLLYRNHRRDQGSYYCVFMSLVSYTEITEETRAHIIVYSRPWSLIQKSQKRPGLILLCIHVPGLLYRNHRRDQGSYYCVFKSLVSYTQITEETRAHIIVYSCPWSLIHKSQKRPGPQIIVYSRPWSLIQKSQKRPGLILLCIHVPGLLYRNHRRDQGSYYCVFMSLVSYTQITEETRAHIIVYSCPWSLVKKTGCVYETRMPPRQQSPKLAILVIHSMLSVWVTLSKFHAYANKLRARSRFELESPISKEWVLFFELPDFFICICILLHFSNKNYYHIKYCTGIQ